MIRKLFELIWDSLMIWDSLGALARRGIFGENFGGIFFYLLVYFGWEISVCGFRSLKLFVMRGN